MKCDMRKCRNWQTSKTKDLVSIALVWVQVPSSAFRNCARFIMTRVQNKVSFFFCNSRRSRCITALDAEQAGNVFTFLMEYENYTFVEALKYLADRAGVELPKMNIPEKRKKKQIRARYFWRSISCSRVFYYQLRQRWQTGTWNILRRSSVMRRSGSLDWDIRISTVMICIRYLKKGYTVTNDCQGRSVQCG